MRVLIASHSAGLRGGAERCVLELARALHDDGRVEPIVTMPMRGELTKALELCRVPTQVMPAPTWLVDPSPPWPRDVFRAGRRVKRLARAIGLVPHWTRWLRELSPDVVMSSTTVSPTPAIAARKAHVPHVWWIHEFTTMGLDKRYALGEPIAQRLMGHLSSRVAVNSRAVAAHYSPPIPDRKIRMIELGVEPSAVQANSAGSGAFRVLMLGRKAPAKGCEIALNAVAQVAMQGVDVHLRMVGPAERGYAATLWYLARDLGVLEHVDFIEYEPDPTAQYEWSNVVLMPSVGEAFGRVTVEALKSGRPVIAARAGATTELVSDGCNGILVDTDDTNGFAAALFRLAHDRSVMADMSRHATASMTGRFTTRGEVETFVGLFSELQRT